MREGLKHLNATLSYLPEPTRSSVSAQIHGLSAGVVHALNAVFAFALNAPAPPDVDSADWDQAKLMFSERLNEYGPGRCLRAIEETLPQPYKDWIVAQAPMLTPPFETAIGFAAGSSLISSNEFSNEKKWRSAQFALLRAVIPLGPPPPLPAEGLQQPVPSDIMHSATGGAAFKSGPMERDNLRDNLRDTGKRPLSPVSGHDEHTAKKHKHDLPVSEGAPPLTEREAAPCPRFSSHDSLDALYDNGPLPASQLVSATPDSTSSVAAVDHLLGRQPSPCDAPANQVDFIDLCTPPGSPAPHVPPPPQAAPTPQNLGESREGRKNIVRRVYANYLRTLPPQTWTQYLSFDDILALRCVRDFLSAETLNTSAESLLAFDLGTAASEWRQVIVSEAARALEAGGHTPMEPFVAACTNEACRNAVLLIGLDAVYCHRCRSLDGSYTWMTRMMAASNAFEVHRRGTEALISLRSCVSAGVFKDSNDPQFIDSVLKKSRFICGVCPPEGTASRPRKKAFRWDQAIHHFGSAHKNPGHIPIWSLADTQAVRERETADPAPNIRGWICLRCPDYVDKRDVLNDISEHMARRHNITSGLENADYCWDPRLHRPQPEAPTCPVPSKGPPTREKPPSTLDSRACSGGYKAPVNLKATEAQLIGGPLPERAWMRIVQLTDGEQLSYECQVAACRKKAFGSLPAIKQHLKDKHAVKDPYGSKP